MGSVVNNVVSGVTSAVFTDRAAGAAAGGQRSANRLNKQMWEEAKQYADPWITGGQGAYDALLATFGIGGEAPNYDAFFNSPDYQFALQQGEQAVQRRQSALGNRLSPGSLMELMRHGQGLASQQLGNYRSGLSGAAGFGMSALGMLQGARDNYTSRGMQGRQNLGDIGAARYLGYGNALGSMMGFGGAGGGGSTYGIDGLMEANAQWGAATGENPYG